MIDIGSRLCTAALRALSGASGIRVRIRASLRVLAAAGILMLLPSCVNDDGGTEIPNELAGREFIAGKGPAAEAELRLVPVGFVPGSTKDPSNTVAILFTARTDAEGRFSFAGVPAGQYNLIASQDGLHSFRDSLAVTGKAQELGNDTLRTPSSLTGRIILAPQDDPRKAIVHLMGTTQFVNVPESGWFTLRDLGPGRYRLRVSVQNSALYTDAFVSFTLAEGRKDTLPDPIVPFFDGIPGVEGLTVEAGPEGTMRLAWKRPDSKRIAGFLVYRDLEGATLPTDSPLVRIKRTDSTYIDSVYRRAAPGDNPKSPQKHYDYFDTVAHTISYHVNILDQSGAVGPTLEIVEAAAKPPALPVSGKWKRISQDFPKRNRVSATFPLRDSLYSILTCDTAGMVWGADASFDTVPMVLASADGSQWTRVESRGNLTAAILAATAWRDTIWALALRPSGMLDSSGKKGIHPFLSLLGSPDGAAWEVIADSLPVEYRREPGFFAIRDSLFVVAGHHNSQDLPALPSWKSADGRKWISMEPNRDPRAAAPAIAAFRGGIHAIGSDDDWPNFTQSLIHSRDGAVWESIAGPPGMLPRFYGGLTEHSGNLWLTGGYSVVISPRRHLSDAWASPDGKSWKLVDGHAPFPARGNHSTFSFRGKLWIVGGVGEDGPVGDVWVMEP